MTEQKVSIICLCYNHERFVREALESVLNQTYSNIQIIIIDDASTDASREIILEIAKNNPAIQFIPLNKNVGLCKAFNTGLGQATGNFIVDFATDDIMMPDKIKSQVDFFTQLDSDYGVVFTDSTYINENGKILHDHYEYLFQKKLISEIPEGNIYTDVIANYFISSPTMMVRREVFNVLGGYDESLAYEDFDFWVRSSRQFKYSFLDKRLTKVRRSQHSMSTGWYKPGDPQLYSTYLVCKKIQALNRSTEEHHALLKRARYELRQSVFSENQTEAKLFYELLIELGNVTLIDTLIYLLTKAPLPLARIRRLYHRTRF